MEYKAQFDYDLLNDWCLYCEGKADFDAAHFSTLLMETLIEGYTEEFDDFIKKITSYFPKSIYSNIKIALGNEACTEEISALVTKDLEQLIKIIPSNNKNSVLIQLLDSKNYRIVNDYNELYQAWESENHMLFYDLLNEYSENVSFEDQRLYTLLEVLYNGITESYHLVYAILAELLGTADLSNYLSIYSKGCDYAIGDDEVVIYQFDGN